MTFPTRCGSTTRKGRSWGSNGCLVVLCAVSHLSNTTPTATTDLTGAGVMVAARPNKHFASVVTALVSMLVTRLRYHHDCQGGGGENAPTAVANAHHFLLI